VPQATSSDPDCGGPGNGCGLARLIPAPEPPIRCRFRTSSTWSGVLARPVCRNPLVLSAVEVPQSGWRVGEIMVDGISPRDRPAPLGEASRLPSWGVGFVGSGLLLLLVGAVMPSVAWDFIPTPTPGGVQGVGVLLMIIGAWTLLRFPPQKRRHTPPKDAAFRGLAQSSNAPRAPFEAIARPRATSTKTGRRKITSRFL